MDVSAIYNSYSQPLPGINKTDTREKPAVNMKSSSGNNDSPTGLPASDNKAIATSPPQPKPDNTNAEAASDNEISHKEKRAIEDLKKTDRAVRAHESAHQSAGGGLVGSASYSYVVAPDGQRYAVGGEVQIDIAEVPDNPEATIRKMQQVRRAALAPADPSAQDRSVATAASAIESKATAQLFQQSSSLSPAKKNKFVNAYISPSPQTTLKGHSVNVLVGNVASGK